MASDRPIRVAGCDCGKDSLYVCILEEVPKNLKSFARSYKPLILKATAEGMEAFLNLEVDLYVMEPTGSYSYIWLQNLDRAGKARRLVSSRRVRHYCEYKGLLNKADRPDAAAIAAFSLENYHDEQSFLNLDRLKIRELFLQLDNTARSKNPVFNRLGQRLSYECPEIVKRYEECNRTWLDGNAPAVYRFLAGESLTGRHSAKREQLLQDSIGTGLSPHTRSLARQLCGFEEIEYDIERAIESEITNPEFEPYLAVFERFAIPRRTQAALLSRIYPFEDFLKDGKPNKEYVRGTNSHRKNGMTKRDRSEGEFKFALGMGKILHQSGGVTEWKAGGSKYARTALWRYVKMTIVIMRSKSLPNFPQIAGELEKQLRQPGVSPWLNEALISAIAQMSGCTPEVASAVSQLENRVGKCF